MRRKVAVGVIAAIVVPASLAAVVAVARPAPQVVVPPVPPVVPRDTGAGEMLLVVVGGVYPSRAEADAAAASMQFGDVQGYYVAPVAQFQGFRQQVGEPGDFALVSAFRTQEGADAFVDFAQIQGNPAFLLPERVRTLGVRSARAFRGGVRRSRRRSSRLPRRTPSRGPCLRRHPG